MLYIDKLECSLNFQNVEFSMNKDNNKHVTFFFSDVLAAYACSMMNAIRISVIIPVEPLSEECEKRYDSF